MVTTTAWIFSLPTIRPLRKPTAVPAAIPASRARGMEPPARRIMPVLTPHTPTMEPTERSMCPDSRRKVRGMEIMPISDTWRRMLNRFPTVRK